jgi:hypothetical protein
MRDPFSRLFSSLSSSQDSLLHRIRENFHQLLTPARIFPSSANGAPIHLPRWERSPRSSRAQGASLITHGAIITALALIAVQPRRPLGGTPETPPRGPFTFFRTPDPSRSDKASLGKKGGGGEEDSRPTRRGLLAPGSSTPILPPRQIVNTAPELPVLSSVFDPGAPQFPAPITNLGLPWMKNDSNSAGPGKNHGFGAGKKGGMGDDE